MISRNIHHLYTVYTATLTSASGADLHVATLNYASLTEMKYTADHVISSTEGFPAGAALPHLHLSA